MRVWPFCALLGLAHASDSLSNAAAGHLSLKQGTTEPDGRVPDSQSGKEDGDLVILGRYKSPSPVDGQLKSGGNESTRELKVAELSDDDSGSSDSDSETDEIEGRSSTSPHGSCVKCKLQSATCRRCVHRLGELIRGAPDSSSRNVWTLVPKEYAVARESNILQTSENVGQLAAHTSGASDRKQKRRSKKSQSSALFEPKTLEVLAQMGITPSTPIPIPKPHKTTSYSYDHAMNWSREAKKLQLQEDKSKSAPPTSHQYY